MLSSTERMAGSFLLILGDAEGLAWVLEHSTMAFAARRRTLASMLGVGDELFVYSTRGCFGNPAKDRGRIIARARAAGPPTVEPTEIAGRQYDVLVRLEFDAVCRLGEGVALAPRVDEMHSFPDPAAWSARMRKPLMQLDPRDADALRRELEPLVRPMDQMIDDYRTIAARRRRRRTAA